MARRELEEGRPALLRMVPQQDVRDQNDQEGLGRVCRGGMRTQLGCSAAQGRIEAGPWQPRWSAPALPRSHGKQNLPPRQHAPQRPGRSSQPAPLLLQQKPPAAPPKAREPHHPGTHKSVPRTCALALRHAARSELNAQQAALSCEPMPWPQDQLSRTRQHKASTPRCHPHTHPTAR
jgi:hypothetical protein